MMHFTTLDNETTKNTKSVAIILVNEFTKSVKNIKVALESQRWLDKMHMVHTLYDMTSC